MEFRRQISDQLNEWKFSLNRKPLILRGARQVGKTTLIKQFARSYKYSILLNLEKESDREYFEKSDDVKTILEALFFSNGFSSEVIGEALLFIDEIQESPKAIHLLRYFYEELPELHVIAAGSLLEFAMRRVSSFPVGRVEYLYLYPLNFLEYLDAIGRHDAKALLKQVPVKAFAHQVLLRLFNRYAIIGGLPEVVKLDIQNSNIADLPKIFESVWESYINDVEKYASNDTERNVIKHIIKAAPFLVDERIKFQNFGNSNYRSREVGDAFRKLDDAKIIRLIYPSIDVEFPVMPDLRKSPRMQFLDSGLINHSLGLQDKMLTVSDLSSSYKGAIIPHVITQELISLNVFRNSKPNFWVREKSQSSSEVDLVYVYDGMVIPIEIKSGSSGKLKSLHQFIDACSHMYAVRVYAGEFSIEKTRSPKGKSFLLMNLPYYLGTLIPQYVKYFVDNYPENSIPSVGYRMPIVSEQPMQPYSRKNDTIKNDTKFDFVVDGDTINEVSLSEANELIRNRLYKILSLIGASPGIKTKEISEKLFVSEITVKRDLKRLGKWIVYKGAKKTGGYFLLN